MLRFALTGQDSLAFAQLSGDFNPLHVDAVSARRLQFGGTICHGVHMVLKAFDLATKAGLLDVAQISSIHAVFGGSVRTASQVEVDLVRDADSGRVRMVASSGGRSVFTVRIALSVEPSEALWLGELPPPGDPAQTVVPSCPEFPTDATKTSLAAEEFLSLNADLMHQLLPSLAKCPHGPQIATDLLATTRIIGMRCPGLHSIYSEFKLHRRDAELSAPNNKMPYSILRADSRFRSVRLSVTGSTLVGTLDAFFRAPPVVQPSLRDLSAKVEPLRFAGQRALIVGGSRGLGELVVKMLLAGGANVALTYFKGKVDAERIQQEALAQGCQVGIFQLNAAESLSDTAAQYIGNLELTHLYYFATQQIAKNSASVWSPSLFEGFCQVYVQGFASVVQAAAKKCSAPNQLHVLYPSTVFLDQPESGFAEYRAAKAAGEALCDSLATSMGLIVKKPRLPRLRTDQNSSFLGVEGADPLPIMLQQLESIQPSGGMA